MKLLFATFTLLAAAALASAGAECQWGPSYWCQNLETAQKCGQVRYCQTNIWQTVDTQEESATACDICKFVAGYLDQYIDNNGTEAEAEKLVKDLCNRLGSLAAECNALVDTYFPDIWKLLEQELEPDVICVQLGLCTSKAKVQVSAVSADACDICKFIAGYLDQMLDNNATESEAENAVKDLCSYLSSFAAECDALVDTYFPDIWKLLVQELEPDVICVQLGLCTKSKVQVGSTVGCDICEFVVTFLDKFLEENSTEEEAKEAVEKLCSVLGSLEQECKDLIDKYFDDIWELLEKELEPDVICTELGLCSSSKTKMLVGSSVECEVCELIVSFMDKFVDSSTTEAEAEKLVDDLCDALGSLADECKTIVNDFFPEIWAEFKKETSPDVVCKAVGLCSSTKAKSAVKVPKASQPQDEICDVCKEVCEFLQQYVDNNVTKEEAKEELEKLCAFFPGNYSTECDELVKEYFDEIWDMLKNEVDKDEICFQLGLCSKNTLVPKQKPTQDLCQICELVVNFLLPYVDSNATEEEVEDALKQLCNLLPSQFASECNSLVNQYFPYIWKLLQSELDHDLICYQLGLCTNSTMSSLPVEKESEDLCDICKLVVNFIKPFVEKNSTKEEVEKALEDLCEVISKVFPECDSFVKEYFPVVWDLIEAYLNDPDEICQIIGLCKNATVALPPKVSVLMREDASDPDTFLCTICEFVMKEIDSLLVSNATEAEIIALVEKICDFLPSTIRKDCDEFIADYGKEIINALVDGIAPRLVCTVIHLCVGEAKETAPMDDCSICKDVLTIVKIIVGENVTKEGVEKVLEYVCSLLPSALKDECDAFVNEYAAAIVQLIDQDIDPEKICQEIGVCPKTSPLASPWKMLERAIRLQN